MNHDSSQSNSISCVRGGSVGVKEVLVACEYPKPRMPWRQFGATMRVITLLEWSEGRPRLQYSLWSSRLSPRSN